MVASLARLMLQICKWLFELIGVQDMRLAMYRLMCKWFGFRVVVYWEGEIVAVHHAMTIEEINEWMACYPVEGVECIAYAGNQLIGRI